MKGVGSRSRVGSMIVLGLGVAAWLWPIGFGGKMPVGGDVTSFSIGLMAVLARAIRSGRIPLWNDLWGFGFPGVAESQMGVFYPPHLVLYGLLTVEAAYTASLVLHSLWGAFGAYWASRRFGVGRAGGVLAGFAWSGCGFYLIHLPHQWGYTVGSWMPWAWGLAWGVVRGERPGRDAARLAAVLALQVLPGHFQLAFETQVGVILIGLAALGERAGWRRVARLGLSLMAALPLSAMQVIPTLRLARLAADVRDYHYLTVFSATPLHLVSYVAPGLFQRSPLWRPLAWDPFQTSPEEHLAYLGLVPLFLALGALGTGLRRDPATRALGLIALATLILSLGPWIPGYGLICRLPGFSFFRAPSRWSLATELALAMLAGQGFDRLKGWVRAGRGLAAFAIVAGLAPMMVLVGVELILWGGKPEIRAVANRPQDDDPRVFTVLARQGRGSPGRAELSFARSRGRIYAQELGETYALIIALLLVSRCAGHRRFFAASLAALTALDLLALSRHRPLDFGPIRPLVAQSPVLARLAESTRGTRVAAGPLKNMPMIADVAPIGAYRTLDLPVVGSLASAAEMPLLFGAQATTAASAMRASGAEVRVLDPFDGRPIALPGAVEMVVDRALAGWVHGDDFVTARGDRASTFRLWRPGAAGPGRSSPPPEGPPRSKFQAPPYDVRIETGRAWLVPLTDRRAKAILESWSGDPADVSALLDGAKPLAAWSDRPERFVIDIEPGDGPAVVVVSQLADPGWRARWSDGSGGSRPVEIKPVLRHPDFGKTGWQSVAVPASGLRKLILEYPGRDVYAGLAVSGLAWLAWGWVSFRLGRIGAK